MVLFTEPQPFAQLQKTDCIISRRHTSVYLQEATNPALFYKYLIAVSDIFDTKKKNIEKKINGLAPLFLYLPFNPADPSSAVIQSAFLDIIRQDDHITTLETGNDFEGKANFDQLIVCYHKQKSILNVLTPPTHWMLW